MSVADLRAIQKQIADLQAVAQHNPRRLLRFDSESDHSAHSSAQTVEVGPETSTGERIHPKLDAFIPQCEETLHIDGCAQDKTHVAYAGSYCHGKPETQWQEYKRRPEHRFPHVITWDDMKKEFRRQLGEEHVSLDQMYDK